LIAIRFDLKAHFTHHQKGKISSSKAKNCLIDEERGAATIMGFTSLNFD